MKFFIISAFASIAIAIVSLTSCSPEPHASLKEIVQPVSAAAHPSVPTEELADSLTGDWVCSPKTKCSYSEISISGKDGLADLRTDATKDSGEVSVEGNIRVNPENKNEILYRGEHYIRKPAPSPSVDPSYVDVI